MIKMGKASNNIELSTSKSMRTENYCQKFINKQALGFQSAWRTFFSVRCAEIIETYLVPWKFLEKFVDC